MTLPLRPFRFCVCSQRAWRRRALGVADSESIQPISSPPWFTPRHRVLSCNTRQKTRSPCFGACAAWSHALCSFSSCVAALWVENRPHPFYFYETGKTRNLAQAQETPRVTSGRAPRPPRVSALVIPKVRIAGIADSASNSCPGANFGFFTTEM